MNRCQIWMQMLRVQMRTVIKKLQRRLGITTIYVTHDQEEALAISDRIAVMKEGNIMQVGTPEEIYKKPENTFVAGFIGVSNFVECDVKGDDPGKAVLDIKGECSIICTLKKCHLMVKASFPQDRSSCFFE